MRRCYPVRIGELWQSYVNDHPDLARRMKEASVGDVWRQVVGERIADATQTNFVRGVFYVRVLSSVLRHELFLNRENLRYEMNQLLGEDMIGTIIVK